MHTSAVPVLGIQMKMGYPTALALISTNTAIEAPLTTCSTTTNYHRLLPKTHRLRAPTPMLPEESVQGPGALVNIMVVPLSASFVLF